MKRGVVVCVLGFRLLKDSETNYSALGKHRQRGPEGRWRVGGVYSWDKKANYCSENGPWKMECLMLFKSTGEETNWDCEFRCDEDARVCLLYYRMVELKFECFHE